MTAPAPSLEDLYNDARAELVDRRPDLTVDDGDIADMILAAIAAVGDRLVGYQADLVRATYVDGAQGPDLTKLASDHWDINRIGAVSAIGSVTFVRATALTAGDINAGTVVATVPDALGQTSEFTTNTLIHFAIGDLGPKTVAVTATTAGLAGNVAPGLVSRITSSLFDKFIVTNPTQTLGGAEEEDDDALRGRIRTFSTTQRRGTLAALELGARQIPQVKEATASEDTSGNVTVFVTDAGGASNAEMVASVLDELENWRAAGSSVTVVGGSLFLLTPIQLSLAVRAGVDIAAIVSDVKLAVVARIAKLKIGETCARAIIQQAALNVDTDNIVGCTVIAPPADVVPSSSQIIRTSVSFITVV